MDREELVRRILKEISDGKEPNIKDYDVDPQQWGELAELIKNNGFAEGVLAQRGGIGNKVVYTMYNNSKITLKGLDYLK